MGTRQRLQALLARRLRFDHEDASIGEELAQEDSPLAGVGADVDGGFRMEAAPLHGGETSAGIGRAASQLDSLLERRGTELLDERWEHLAVPPWEWNVSD